MGLFRRRDVLSQDEASESSERSEPWDLPAILEEWPDAEFDSDEDMKSWHRGMDLYDAAPENDYVRLREAVGCIVSGLRHELRESEFFPPSSVAMHGRVDQYVIDSCWNTVVGSILGRDQYSLDDSDRKHIRLALAVMLQRDYQHRVYGGDDALGQLFENKFLYSMMGSGVEPMQLREWFGAPPGANIEFSS